MNRILCYVLLLLLSFGSVKAQSTRLTNEAKKILEQTGPEMVLLHQNAEVLLVGDYLYYSIYCLNKKSRKFSELSKVAYVELVGPKNEKVFKHKLALTNGLSRGDFFIPVSVQSGNYKLLAYTQWATNWGMDYIFQSDLTIINPYTNNQSVFRVSDKENFETKDGISFTNDESPIDASIKESNAQLSLKVNKNAFGNREKVQLSISPTNSIPINGNFSLSVRRKYQEFSSPKSMTAFFNKMIKDREATIWQKDSLRLPELRGQLFAGSIGAKAENLPVNNQKVFFSTPEKNYKLRMVTTDENGKFYFSVANDYYGDVGLLQVYGSNNDQYQINVDNSAVVDYDKIEFGEFVLKPEMQKIIEQQSVHNQIENAYFEAKPDTLKTVAKDPFFSNQNSVEYILDDYTRFPSVQETFVEIIDNVQISQDNTGEFSFYVRGLYSDNTISSYEPLVIVDGVVLQDFQRLIEYDARNIEAIRVIRSKYVLGSQIFQGVVDIKTFEGDFYEMSKPTYIYETTLFSPLPQKDYFKQVYDQNNTGLEAIPDYRHQLLWLPNISLTNKPEELTFFTSDVSGEFEIVLQGFTDAGQPITLREYFAVE